MSTEQLTLTCTSKANLLADLTDHFDSLGLTLPEFTFSLPDHPSGVAEAVMDDGTRVLISVQENFPSDILAADFILEGENAASWRDIFCVPLTSTDTIVIHASRDDLIVPATSRGTGTVRPITPSHQISGIEPLPPLEGNDYEPPADWAQPEGAHDAYSLGAIVSHNGSTWVSLIAANVWEPGGANWREVVKEGSLPAWVQPTGAGDAYTVDDEVTHNGEDWKSRRAVNVSEPGTSNSGWYQTSNTPAPWVHVGNEGYPASWQVTHNGRLWNNPSANNFWEPGVALWVDIGPAP